MANKGIWRFPTESVIILGVTVTGRGVYIQHMSFVSKFRDTGDISQIQFEMEIFFSPQFWRHNGKKTVLALDAFSELRHVFPEAGIM